MPYYSKKQTSLRSINWGDLEYLSATLRLADRAELAATHPGPVFSALRACVEASSQSAVLVHQGHAVALFGLCPRTPLGCSACVWLLTGNEVEKIPKTFFKTAKAVLSLWLKQYPHLYNCVDARYLKALAFVRRLGGVFDEQEVYFGPHRFLIFHLRRK